MAESNEMTDNEITALIKCKDIKCLEKLNELDF